MPGQRRGRRLIEPLVSVLRERGVEQAELRAETALATLLGIITLRSTGDFPALAAASTAELTAFVERALGELVDREGEAGER